MPTPTVPLRPDDEPARWVTALWSRWVDPVEEAFADLAAQVELEALRRQLGRPAAPTMKADVDQVPQPGREVVE